MTPGDEALHFLHRWDAARYERSWLLAGLEEKAVQTRALDTLKRTWEVWAHVTDAGAKNLRGKAFGAMRRMGASSTEVQRVLRGAADLQAGFPDTHGVLWTPTGPLPWYIEWKAPAHLAPDGHQLRAAEKPTPDQLAFLKRAESLGCAVGVAWHTDDAVEILGPARLEAHRREMQRRYREGVA